VLHKQLVGRIDTNTHGARFSSLELIAMYFRLGAVNTAFGLDLKGFPMAATKQY
jgi:hypothetical protein